MKNFNAVSTSTSRHRISVWTRYATAVLSRITLMLALVFALCPNVEGQSYTVRLGVVNIPVDSGLLAELLPDFEKSTGYRVEMDKRGDDLYDRVRQGKADLVISHYGHVGVQAFMEDGLGLWPRAVFANQSVLIGPSTDPAGIRGLKDAVEAFRLIAKTKSRFLVNNAATEKYLGQLLQEASDRPDAGDWLIDSGLRDQPAVQAAEKMDAYVLWGVVPFLKFKESVKSGLEALVVDDPLFQRGMVSIVVNPEKISGVNIAGAISLQNYLGAPATQAKIRAFRYSGFDPQLFWPTARDNSPSFLAASGNPPGKASDPIATSISFDPASVRLGGPVTATFSGTNLSELTYFDVRFRVPGSTTDEVALNWQQGTSGVHTVPLLTATGIWKVTGLRAHGKQTDQTGSFIPVSASLTVLP